MKFYSDRRWLMTMGLLATWALTVNQSFASPNFVIIYTDDQGSFDLRALGAKDLKTPNLDALAGEGVVFSQMYAPSSVCSASRAGLLTGRFPMRSGVAANVSSIRGVAGMAPNATTIAEHLKKNGYRTGHIGKWHLGYTPETMPNAQGFDESWGHMTGVIDNYSHFFFWEGPPAHDLWRNGREIWAPGEKLSQLTKSEIAKFLAEGDGRPFLLYWATNLPHYPMQPNSSSLAIFESALPPRKAYLASMLELDQLVGFLVEELEARELLENTYIIVQSDNGHSVELRADGGGGFAGLLRGHKGSLFEAGIRVPAIFWGPSDMKPTGHEIPPGRRDGMATAMDWFPTILDLAAIPAPEDGAFDGRSLLPMLQDPSVDTPHDFLFWQLGANAQTAQWAIRSEKWKLLGNAYESELGRSGNKVLSENKELMLIDLSSDVGEIDNLASERPDIVIDLLKRRQQIIDSL